MGLYYLDTSAAFKLLAAEEHAEEFLAFYRERRDDDWVSSDLLRIEVTRAVARHWPALIPDAQRLLDAFQYVPIDEEVVRGAMVEPDPLLRSLDAIHLTTARLLGTELAALLTYDDRMSEAAEAANIPVHAPRSTGG
ncbi:type II toxin-antitoxin system VapC family toxin [Amycolatopsis pithecellobii]|uniref:type II toxin-antitoxin system VapC family toxin n=1 Tax=Amycolatopsis pithecellobii TaxID=664692 RepID=UPI00140DE8A2|nr:type II toxin-antitoxin system VapC family toxin [Amycolatopsis pithecellobii]